jgi:hypothetical protein
MPAEAAEGAVSRTRERKTSTSYALGLLCECGARRSDGSRRWCAECRYSKAPWEMSSVEAATSPWWAGRRWCAEQERKVEDMVSEALNLLFARYRKAEIAPRS